MSALDTQPGAATGQRVGMVWQTPFMLDGSVAARSIAPLLAVELGTARLLNDRAQLIGARPSTGPAGATA